MAQCCIISSCSNLSYKKHKQFNSFECFYGVKNKKCDTIITPHETSASINTTQNTELCKNPNITKENAHIHKIWFAPTPLRDSYQGEEYVYFLSTNSELRIHCN